MEEQEQFIHHSPKDKNPHGCLPLYTILSLVLILGLLLGVDVVMPEAVQDRGEANIYYRNSPFSYSDARVESPLPLSLPSFADPAQTNEFFSTPSTRRAVSLNGAPAISPFQGRRNSAILRKDDLLALPPEMQKLDEQETEQKGSTP